VTSPTRKRLEKGPSADLSLYSRLVGWRNSPLSPYAGCGRPPATRTGPGQKLLTIRPGVHSDPRGATQQHPGYSGGQGGPRLPLATVGALDTYQIYDGTDENGIVGTVAPGLFAQEGRCWRMVYENPVGHPTHCMMPVEWVGRWKFQKGWNEGVVVRTARGRAGGA
jgi:hypothetical protein